MHPWVGIAIIDGIIRWFCTVLTPSLCILIFFVRDVLRMPSSGQASASPDVQPAPKT